MSLYKTIKFSAIWYKKKVNNITIKVNKTFEKFNEVANNDLLMNSWIEMLCIFKSLLSVQGPPYVLGCQ